MRARRKRRRGVVIVTVAVLLVALMAFTALAVDLGRSFSERRSLQAAADAAAEAGAMELYASAGSNTAAASAAALRVAELYGYTASPNKVTVNIPPKSGAFQGKAGYVEVLIDTQVSRSFSVVLASGDVNVGARAVAAGTLMPSMASVLILDPKRKDSLKLKGKGSSLSVEGDIVVNSKDKRSIRVDKKAQIQADHLLLTGGIDKKSRGLIDAEVETGVTPTPDPYASLPAPSKGTSYDAKDFLTTVDKQEHYALEPGYYKDLKFDDDDVVTMAPGTYYVSGKFELKDFSALSATGVTIFQDGKKGMKFHTTGNVSVTPPTTGPYKGVSLFQSPSSKAKMEFKKGRDYDVGGVIYCPNGAVKFSKTDLSSDDDEDWEADEDFEETLADDFEVVENSALTGSIIARQLTVDKGSHVKLLGANINVNRPLRGLVE
jgi:Flp pilus assembly protein TadG